MHLEKLPNDVSGTLFGTSISTFSRDTTKREGINSPLPTIAALCIFASAKYYDKVDEPCDMSRSLSRESVVAFVASVTTIFGAKYR